VNRLRALLDFARSPAEFIELIRSEIAAEKARNEEALHGGSRGLSGAAASSPLRGIVPWAKASQIAKHAVLWIVAYVFKWWVPSMKLRKYQEK
jgi:hypothetical protein